MADTPHASPAERLLASDLDEAFLLAKVYVDGNAYHSKRGIRLLEQSSQDVLDHLKEEVAELEAEPDDINEMADILALCANYSSRKSWTPAMLAEAIVRKMRLRLSLGVMKHKAFAPVVSMRQESSAELTQDLAELRRLSAPVSDAEVEAALENYGLACCYVDDPCSPSTQEDCRERACHKIRMRAALEAAHQARGRE
jgi:hypothetical protein